MDDSKQYVPPQVSENKAKTVQPNQYLSGCHHMIIAFLFFNMLLVLALTFVNYPITAIRYVIPYPFNSAYVPIIVGLIFCMVSAYLIAIRKRIEWTAIQRPLLEIMLVFPAGYLIIWLKKPFGYSDSTVGLLYIVLFLAVLFFFYCDRNHMGTWGFTATYLKPALKALVLPTLLLLSIVVITAFFSGNRFRLSNTLISILTYPFYAFAQLLVFLVFPVQRFKRLTRSKPAIVIATATLFALIHWPNMLLVFGSFFAMIIWCMVYLRSPNIYAISLSMGIVASIFIQTLPLDLTHHAKIASGYMSERLSSVPPEIVYKHLESAFGSSSVEHSVGTHEMFFEKVYNILLETPPMPEDLKTWATMADLFGRKNSLIGFLRSLEFQAGALRLSQTETYPRSEIRGYVYVYNRNKDTVHVKGRVTHIKTGGPVDSILVFTNNNMIQQIQIKDQSAPDDDCPSADSFQFSLPIKEKAAKSGADGKIRFFGLTAEQIPTELLFYATPSENEYNTSYPIDFDKFILRAYIASFGRCPDNDGNFYYMFKLFNGSIDCAAFFESILLSQEFQKQNTSDKVFVMILFRMILDREPLEDELGAWLNQLDAGADRTEIVRAFTRLEEFQMMCQSNGIPNFR